MPFGDWIEMISISDFRNLPLNLFDMSDFHEKEICFLGGTGFIGTWLINVINQVSYTQGVRVGMTIYTRDKAKALIKFPESSFGRLKIKEFDFSRGSCDLGLFDFFVNGATPTAEKPGADSKSIFYDPTVNAIQSVIDSARKYGNRPRVLNLSSGAVYGAQPMSLAHRPEGAAKNLDDSDDDYRASKIASEHLLESPNVIDVLTSSSPRLFTFFGPGVPLDRHFAVGNFIRDGLCGQPIRVQGNPLTKRSYMFPTDLVVWLLKSLLNPKCVNLNIGSEISISMHELASLVSSMTSNKGVLFLNPSAPANNYVPATGIFRSIYDVEETVGLETGLDSWASWLKKYQLY
jgi:nucleoside-diphosphate-sugar epimerase